MVYPDYFANTPVDPAVRKIPLQLRGANTVSIASHKFYGLNGSGLLIKKRELAP